MRDPLHEAMKRRKAHGLDLSIVIGPHADKEKENLMEERQKGDLAPEVKEFGEEPGEDSPDKMAAERKAMHAKANDDLKSAVHHNEIDNPEHEPLVRGEGHDELGHEQSGADNDFEQMMKEGHEHDMPSRPRTLGARVRAALHSKKKGI